MHDSDRLTDVGYSRVGIAELRDVGGIDVAVSRNVRGKELRGIRFVCDNPCVDGANLGHVGGVEQTVAGDVAEDHDRKGFKLVAGRIIDKMQNRAGPPRSRRTRDRRQTRVRGRPSHRNPLSP